MRTTAIVVLVSAVQLMALGAYVMGPVRFSARKAVIVISGPAICWDLDPCGWTAWFLGCRYDTDTCDAAGGGKSGAGD